MVPETVRVTVSSGDGEVTVAENGDVPPEIVATVVEADAEPPWRIAIGPPMVRVGAVEAAVMAKFTFETSKKTLPTACTLTRAWFVAGVPRGMVTASVPSLGVEARSVVGHVLPPSSESRMATLAQLTGAAVVDATFQVTVWPEPAAQETAVFGAVTWNGPAVEVTLTVIVSFWTPPPPARLSRAVTRKVIVRVVAGSTSAGTYGEGSVAGGTFALARMYFSRGKVREGLEDGSKGRKIGAFPFSPGAPCGPRSNSSHAYVRASPFGSEPVAVSVNGVDLGIVTSAPAETVGAPFPVALEAAHVPEPVVV